MSFASSSPPNPVEPDPGRTLQRKPTSHLTKRPISPSSIYIVRRDIAILMTLIVGGLAFVAVFQPEAVKILDKLLPVYAMIITYYFLHRSRLEDIQPD